MDISVLIGPFCGFLMIAGVVGGIVYAFIHRRKQVERYSQWAAQNGLHYQAQDSSIAAMSTRSPFGVGSSRTGQDVFRGMYKGRHLVFGLYKYTTGSGKNSSTHIMQFVAVSLPAPRPFLDITRETAGSKFLAMFGKRDLQLESQEFNDRFKVDTDNERFAYDVLSPQNMQWLLADVRANMYQYRFEGQWLMTMRAGKLRLDEVYFYADFLHDLVNIVPRHVWQG